MGVARVVFNKRSLIDVTQDTVKEEYLLAGETTLGADGEVVEGSAQVDKQNEIVEGTLGGDYINSMVTSVGNFGMMRVDNNQEEELTVKFNNVVSIGTQGFYYCTYLKNVYVPNCTSLGNSSFMGCDKLESFDGPEVTTLGSTGQLFQGCTNLRTVNLPKAKNIPANSFRDCSNLEYINADSATTFQTQTNNNGNCFLNCISLTYVSLPKMGYSSNTAAVFKGCVNLLEVNLPNMTALYGNEVFSGCSSLKGIVLPKYGTGTNANYQISTNWFLNCSSMEYFDTLGAYAIAATAFSGCSVLDVVIIRNTARTTTLSNISAFNNSPFASGGSGGVLYVPQSRIDSYSSATNWATILGYTNNRILPIEGSDYEFFFADGRPINEKPMYTLDGTYVNTENDTQIVIENGHWHITAQYTGGTKTINLFQFPAAAVSGQRTWKGIITNFNQITSGGGMGGINGANDWGQSYEICGLASGDQENSIQITPTSPDVRLWYLRYARPYGAAFECEFDFSLYVNDVWYC